MISLSTTQSKRLYLTALIYSLFYFYSGAKVELREHENCTALLIAAKYGHTETVSVLMKNRAKVTAVDKDDRTILHQCAGENHLEALRVRPYTKYCLHLMLIISSFICLHLNMSVMT